MVGCDLDLNLAYYFKDSNHSTQGATAILEGGRYKLVSDGDNNNMIMMAVTKVKTTDEGEYRVVIENEHGKDEKSFMLYVSDSSGMDFRSMLKKKKYAKWGNDDEGPDWGDLKHHDKPEEPVEEVAKPVSNTVMSGTVY